MAKTPRKKKPVRKKKPEIHKEAPLNPEQLEKCKEYIVNLGGDESLLNGWEVRTTTRSNRRTQDSYIFDTDGKKYRSRPEVARSLELMAPDNRQKPIDSSATKKTKRKRSENDRNPKKRRLDAKDVNPQQESESDGDSDGNDKGRPRQIRTGAGKRKAYWNELQKKNEDLGTTIRRLEKEQRTDRTENNELQTTIEKLEEEQRADRAEKKKLKATIEDLKRKERLLTIGVENQSTRANVAEDKIAKVKEVIGR